MDTGNEIAPEAAVSDDGEQPLGSDLRPLGRPAPDATVSQQAIVPVTPDPIAIQSLVAQHLGLELANRSVEFAQMRARIDLVLQAYASLHPDTWVQHVAQEPSFADGQMLQLEGPISIPPGEREALSRLLAAVELLR